jgi:hypothetical protein
MSREGIDVPERSIPHLCFHVAPDYNEEALAQMIEGLSARSRALRVRSLGLGIFPGPEPVGYTPVVRSPELNDFQISVWSAAAMACEKPVEFFHPSRWLPHITLVPHLAQPTRGKAIELLLREIGDDGWEVEINELAVMDVLENHHHEISLSRPMQGTARNF